MCQLKWINVRILALSDFAVEERLKSVAGDIWAVKVLQYAENKQLSVQIATEEKCDIQQTG